MPWRNIALALGLAIAACAPPATPPAAEVAAAPAIQVERAIVAPSLPGREVTAAYMLIRNMSGEGDRLISASTPAARSVEIHETRAEPGGIVRMAALEEGLALPASGAVELAPHGLHLMLIGVVAPLSAGDSVALTLTFERAGAISIDAQVAIPTGGEAHSHR